LRLVDPDLASPCYFPRMTSQRNLSSVAASRAALMRWYLEVGVDETIGEAPVDRFVAPAPARVAAPPSASAPPSAPAAGRATTPESRVIPPVGAPRAQPQPRPESLPPKSLPPKSLLPEEMVVQQAVSLASNAASLTALKDAVNLFDGCPLKRTATNLVFGRGNPAARIVFIGEAPGAEEDLRGAPFVGPSGRLLDRMLGSIGLASNDVFISNTVFWRPPGNRSPTSSETAACMPFLQRMLELIDPDVVVALGGPAAAVLLGRAESVGKLRGRWFPYQSPGLSRPASATATFHPAYLLRSPAQKRLAWRDFLAIKRKLADSLAAHRATGEADMSRHRE
jgi:uracil-DNA glycosylase